MAISATTLSRAKAVNDKFISVTSATNAVVKGLALVDGEFMRITDISLSPILSVVPGYNGTAAGPHGVGAPVILGPTTDWSQTQGPQTLSFEAAGAITGPGGAGTLPVVDTMIFLTGGAARAYTIAAPAVDQQNTLTFISVTAFAHTLTMTGNAAAQDVATWPAVAGTMLAIKADRGSWAPRATSGAGGVVVA